MTSITFNSFTLLQFNSLQFHYFIKNHFDAELLITDADSLTDEIKSENVYEEFLKQKHLFDFSNFPRNFKLFDKANKKVIGKMKYLSERKYMIKVKDVFLKKY